MQLRLLGPVELVDDGGRPVALGGPKERRVLATLAVHLDQPVSEARLIDALWGDEPPATATKTLQAYVSRVRKVLAQSDDLRVDSVQSGYVLRSEPGAIDTAEVDALVAAAREDAAQGRADAAAEGLRAAAARWRGPALGDLADEPFALAEAARLDELRSSLVEERIELDLARGRHAEMIGELEALTTRHPLRERLWRARMLALYRTGRQADALRAFQDLRLLLGDELGIDPAPELRALEDAILQQDPSLDLAKSAAGSFPTPASGALPTGVVTILLTDVEGSTRLWDAAPQARDAALQRHDAILAGAVEARGGRLLKSRGEGDSSFSVFGRASQAAAAALDAQAALAAEPWPPGAAIRVRMAIHMGEAAEREQDYYGPAVNRVARLRALAAGGEILVSRSTAEVLADQVGAEFQLVELGERVLKDLSRPEHVFALGSVGSGVAIDGLASVGPAVPAGPALAPGLSPPPLARALARDDLCLGRGDQLARLDVLWDKAQDGFRQAVLVAGEPGIGKTTLAAAFARRVHDSGGVVLYGRCDEDLGVAFQPFAEALRSLVAALPDDQLLGLGHHAGHLSRLLPELTLRLPNLASPIPADAEAERYTLFEAVVALLASAAQQGPVLLVLDDLHWAAKPTLLMLRHLVRAETAMRVMVVGTYRDTEVDRSHPFGDVLADLRREPAVARFALSGLDVDSVQELVAATAGHALDATGLELTDALHRQTNGNPFFVAEVLRHLAETGAVYQDAEGHWTSDLAMDQLGLPEGVRDVVGRRLSRLSAAANHALGVGAVVGPGFDLRLLEAIPEAGDAAVVLDALEEGVAAGLLSEDRGTYWFAHALVRQTLLDELTSTRRLRLHRRVAEAIETVAPDDLEALAFHFAEAALDGVADKAVDCALAAGRRLRERSKPRGSDRRADARVGGHRAD
ncbi:MAG: BTAD domain-containing putative transcriptional regulator [Microthrixaceae bacterium]